MARICIVSPARDAYCETFVRAHIERLPAEVEVIYGGTFPLFHSDETPVLPPGPLIRRAWRVFLRGVCGVPQERFERDALRRFLAQRRIDAVLTEYARTGVTVMEACSDAGVPLIVHFHGVDAYKQDYLEDAGKRYPQLFANAAAIIAVSRDMERQLLSLGAPREKLHHNACGVETSLFQGAEPASAPPTFVVVGRFVDKKAPHLSLLAFKQVLDAHPEASLTMIGDGPLLEACKQIAAGLGLGNAVAFPGPLPHADVATAMRRARALVQHSVRTSSGDSEGTPVAVLEAQAAGLPVVATRHGGIVDVVLENETGLLVDEGDVRGMAEEMLRLAREPEMAARLGKAARARICAEFSMEKSIATLWRIIEKAMAQSAKAAS